MTARRPSLLGVAVRCALMHARSDRSPTLFVLGVVQPATFTSVTLLARQAGAQIEAERALLGCGLLSIWGMAIWQAGLVLRQEQWQGTLVNLVSRPVPLAAILVGKALGATVRSAALIALTVGSIGLLVGEPLTVERPAVFVAVLVAALLSASAMGFLLSGLFLLSRWAVRLAEVLGYPVFILGGMLIPLAVLPGWARPLSAVVSLRWAGDLLGGAASGGTMRAAAWAGLALTSVAYALAGTALLARVLHRARREATLDLY